MVDKNIYLIGIKEGENNDWAPTKDGYLQFENNIAMVRQQIDGRIKTLPGEIDDFDGVDYLNVIFSNTPILTKAQAITEAIQTLDTVKSVEFKGFEVVDRKEGAIRMAFDIDTVFGDLNYSLFLDEENSTISSNFNKEM